MKKMAMAALLGCVVLLSGCGVIPKTNGLTAALTIDQVSSAEYVDNAVKPLKKGEAKVRGIVLFTNGDASIAAAMKNGGITKIHHVDYKVKNIFFMYSEQTVIVWGE